MPLKRRLIKEWRPGPGDLADLAGFYERETQRFEREPGAARALLAGEAGESATARRAALATVGSVLLNLDVTLTRE